MSRPKIGVLLMALGGPSSLDEVEPYLAHVRHGRETPKQFIEGIKERYRLIGGKSPLPDIVQSQAHALELYLNERFTFHVSRFTFKTYIGMRHWHPFIKDTFKRILEDGVSQIAAICLAPQYSAMSVGAYFKEIELCREQFKANIKITPIESWATNRFLLEALARSVEDGKRKFSLEEQKNLPVIFTAHSLPRRIVEEGDPYEKEVMATVEGVAKLIELKEWHLAYQSKSPSQEPWLGPSVEEVLEEIAAGGGRRVLVAPVGFVCDNLEILYDIDILYKGFAQARNMHLERTASLNTNPLLIQAMASLVQEAVPSLFAESVLKPRLRSWALDST